MSEISHRHNFPFIQPAQAQKHVTHNQALEQIDHTHHMCLKAINLSASPDNPEIGDCYDLGETPLGIFENQANKLAAFSDTGWQFYPKVTGMTALNLETGNLIIYDGTDWKNVSQGDMTAPSPAQTLTQLGVNTQPDDRNRLSVKSDAVLLSADDQSTDSSGDIRVAINKNTAENTASHIYQTNYTAYAETGLSGSNNYTIRISDIGNQFKTAFEIDKDTGFIGLGKTPTEPLGIQHDAAGISRLSVSNAFTDSFAGTGLNLISGNNQVFQLLQYNSGACYVLSNSSSMFYQITGPNPNYRFFLGSDNVFGINHRNIETNVPLKLTNITLSNLPSARLSGPGAIIYIPDTNDGASLAYSDGTNWRSSITGNIIQS